MPSINTVTLLGRLGADPEIKDIGDDKRVANLSVATSESWKSKDNGERQEKTQWHRIVIFNEALIEIAEKRLHKGSKVFLEGQLETRKWQDKDHADHYMTEIVIRPYKGELFVLDAPVAAAPSEEPSRPATRAKPKAERAPRPAA